MFPYLCNKKSMQYLTPFEVNSGINNNESITIIDVREPYEHDICNIGALHIPMAEITNRIAEIPLNSTIVVMCKSGNRAEAVANLLKAEHGVDQVAVMKGGIMAWIEEVDSNLEVY